MAIEVSKGPRAHPAKEDIMPLPASHPSLKIVLVVTDPELSRQARETLEQRFGHHVVAEANTGPAMTRTLQSVAADVVVFDIHLPHMTGLEAIRQVRLQRSLAAVALADSRDLDHAHELLAEQVETCLIKPLEPHNLGPAVLTAWHRFSEARRLREENASLRQSLQNRKIVERTKGVLMKRHHWSEAEAYRRLQRGAMNQQKSLPDLAQAILNGAPVDL